jgi:hypothetical protein
MFEFEEDENDTLVCKLKKSFVWSETDIKDVIRYHTQISDRLEI